MVSCTAEIEKLLENLDQDAQAKIAAQILNNMYPAEHVMSAFIQELNDAQKGVLFYKLSRHE